MSFRKRLAVFFLLLILAGVIDALFAPYLVAHGVGWWIEWAARRQGLAARIERVEAPFLRPVTIRNLSIEPQPAGRHEIALQVATVVVDLNLRGWLFRKDAQLLRSVEVDRLTGNIRLREKSRPGGKLEWRQFARLLPDEFQFNDLNLEVTTPTSAIRLRGVLLTASTIESGRFFAREIFVTTPLLRQTFRNLGGATSWESSRLTIAGIPLARGLDLEALTFDLSRLTKQRLGIDLHLDTYGGTLRASFLGRGGDKFLIDLAGSAANISLAQISGAMGFLEPVTGSVRASKFTFRGNPGEFLNSTASIWMEVTDFAWRARRAESVMLGATFYDRRLEVDQLYVRQRENELTVNGELLWPRRLQSWAQLPFRGQINATIPDLNGFAQLFGATTGDFSGALTAKGEVDLVEAETSGRLAWDGQDVTFRGVKLNSLGAAIQLHGREVTLEKLEARHGEDFLRGQGSIELMAGHRFSGRLTGAIGDLGVYAPLLPAAWRSGKIGGGATFDWQGDGTLSAHSGTVQFFARGLQLPVAPLRLPLDLTLEGSYSPRDIFFRTFNLANEHLSLGGFLMFGSNFIELQAFDLSIDGKRRAGGTLFLPLSFERWRATQSWLAALDEKQKFDVDLSLDHLDLGKLGETLGENSLGSGILDGKLAAFGALGTLQVTTDWRLENFGTTNVPSAIDFHGRLEGGRLEAKATAGFGFSGPVSGRASLPLRLEKKLVESGGWLDPTAALSASLDVPALFLETLPNEWRWGTGSGLVTGNISWSGNFPAPAVSGEGEIVNAEFQPGAPWPTVSDLHAHLRFGEGAAAIDPLRCEVDGVALDLRARLTMSPSGFGLALYPGGTEIEMLDQPPVGTRLASVRLLGEGRSEGGPRLREALGRGTIWPGAFSLTTTAAANLGEGTLQRTYFSPSGLTSGTPLLLRVVTPEARPALELAPPNEKR